MVQGLGVRNDDFLFVAQRWLPRDDEMVARPLWANRELRRRCSPYPVVHRALEALPLVHTLAMRPILQRRVRVDATAAVVATKDRDDSNDELAYEAVPLEH
eukprot:CAMPEP_0117477790 /NCGR_PEP_ID=MMETSP0784-20121206/11007_1 /TAXON_ID=39447 /ORGANISM="" /LENGTH=100 /DNA_ID=CAMNT_0005272109 /DNA_START=384 /DNA_END=686 /DNA_ORIENTATION=-